MVTKPQKSSDTAPDAKVTGSFNGKENINYTVEIDASGSPIIKGNGKVITPISGTGAAGDGWNLGNGIQFEVDVAASKGHR